MGDFEGEELGGSRAHVAHHPVSSRAQPARRATGLAPSLTRALKGDPKHEAQVAAVYLSKVGSVKHL